MRSEVEMYDLILGFAKQDARVLAVEMNGSRTNPNAKVDCFQDFDIVYYVSDVGSFTCDHSWIDFFGERIMLQMPELNRNPINDGHFTYLILFTDGNRLDLSLVPVSHFDPDAIESQSVLLYAKDDRFRCFPPASDRCYHIKPTTELDYNSACNNFWWCAQNVAKGLWRRQLPYAMLMIHGVLRPEFHDMLDQFVGLSNGFQVTTGTFGKYYQDYLTGEQYQLYCSTYSDSDYDAIWDSLFAMCRLFRETATAVGDAFGFVYPHRDDEAMSLHLQHVRSLESSAAEIY